MQIFDFKKGSSFGANCVYTPDAGGPTDLTGVTIVSSVRDSRGFAYNLTVNVIDATHFSLICYNTQPWYPGTAFWDIQFSINGTVFYSDTVLINVLNNVTVNPVATTEPY